MTTMSVEELFEQHIRPLTLLDRLRLIALIVHEEVPIFLPEKSKSTHSLLELEGLGTDIWAGIDAQQYVDRLRDDWDRKG